MKKFQSLGESTFKQFTKAQMRSIVGGVNEPVDQTLTGLSSRDGIPAMDDRN